MDGQLLDCKLLIFQSTSKSQVVGSEACPWQSCLYAAAYTSVHVCTQREGERGRERERETYIYIYICIHTVTLCTYTYVYIYICIRI